MPRRTLTDKGVAALRPRAQRYAFPDPELRGHWIRIQPSGVKSFVTVARDPDGKQIWTTIGATDVVTIAEARDKAREAIGRVRDGLPAIELTTKPDSFEDVAAEWIKRHGEAKRLRSLSRVKRLLRVHVYRRWAGRAFLDIKRSDVAKLLDHVEDHHGARQADLVLTVVRSIMNWQATRSDYVPVVVKGMARVDARAQARARVLDDDEIRAIWSSAAAAGRFGAIVKLALLTAQRRAKLATMRWQDLSDDGVWSIPLAPREKGNAGTVQLAPAALAIINSVPRTPNPYVFGVRGDQPFGSFGKCVAKLNKQLHGMKPWVFHDLRRTARSLMSRSGVRPDIAERVMGHAIAGVEGIYDRHTYAAEKAHALGALAALVGSIVNPRDNITAMRQRAKR